MSIETRTRSENPTEALVRRLAVIDDDDLSRGLLELIAAEAGFECESFASGDEAVASLAGGSPPFAVLTDMQMPGLSGNALGEALRKACGVKTRLVAMSGSPVDKAAVSAFDGFLLKPFSAEELNAAIEGAPVAPAEIDVDPALVLNEAVYLNFAKSMPPAQLAGLYKMCLDDARKRLETMRRASENGDDAGYRRAAHAIKGGCGMVGATELAGIAAAMERNGLSEVHDVTPFAHFEAASRRLERMLEVKANGR